MSDVVVGALIAAVASIIVNLISTSVERRKASSDTAVRDKVMELRLASFEKKLDLHNSYADKITSLVQDVALIKKDIEYIKSR